MCPAESVSRSVPSPRDARRDTRLGTRLLSGGGSARAGARGCRRFWCAHPRGITTTTDVALTLRGGRGSHSRPLVLGGSGGGRRVWRPARESGFLVGEALAPGGRLKIGGRAGVRDGGPRALPQRRRRREGGKGGPGLPARSVACPGLSARPPPRPKLARGAGRTAGMGQIFPGGAVRERPRLLPTRVLRVGGRFRRPRGAGLSLTPEPNH